MVRPVLSAVATSFAAVLALVTPSLAAPVSVRVANESVPTLCAEEDNVDLRLSAPNVRRFRIEANHPAVIGTIVQDTTAPDFTDCTITDKADFRFTPRNVVMHEDDKLKVVGITFDKFWRPEQVPVTVGNRTESGFHLFQLFVKDGTAAPYEFLVMYPVDGYWRIKPRPPAHLPDIVYGTSALIGPIEVMQRPVVNLSAIRFDPATMTFTLSFRAGGTATVKVAEVDRTRVALDVVMERPVANGPFAGLRSMYVTETNADGARVEWRAAGANRWQEAPVMDFRGGEGIEMKLTRAVPSRHNTSSPDYRFIGFGD
ncbi:hypothetical protein [Phreatobacter oligotrophus]|jgi:hypothetical protein|uniref:hypothetical protein n=1 Tax=Phreatobacter oligotrophus TaxID=1122261 RepID=UPI0023547E67|nr:hypothetical protein [Phreatobacter oligotrophus]MBX9993066.1 hypothetical protein [Phreatobacter oligotrophus]